MLRSVPEVGSQLRRLSRLTFLHLSGRAVSGATAAAVGSLGRLRRLELELCCRMTEGLQSAVGQLSQLHTLLLLVNSIPPSTVAAVGLLSALVSLHLTSELELPPLQPLTVLRQLTCLRLGDAGTAPPLEPPALARFSSSLQEYSFSREEVGAPGGLMQASGRRIWGVLECLWYGYPTLSTRGPQAAWRLKSLHATVPCCCSGRRGADAAASSDAVARAAPLAALFQPAQSCSLMPVPKLRSLAGRSCKSARTRRSG